MVPVLTTSYGVCWIATFIVTASLGELLSADPRHRRETSLGWSMLAGLVWPLLAVGIVEAGLFVVIAAVLRSRESALLAKGPYRPIPQIP